MQQRDHQREANGRGERDEQPQRRERQVDQVDLARAG